MKDTLYLQNKIQDTYKTVLNDVFGAILAHCLQTPHQNQHNADETFK